METTLEERRRTAEEARNRKDEIVRKAAKQKQYEETVEAFKTEALLQQQQAHAKSGSGQNQRPFEAKEPQIQIPPYELKRPQTLPAGDDRFNKIKTKRTYACDSCGNLVGYSSWTRQTGSRALGEFQGSYVDHSWAGNVPPQMIERAYNEGLIDCTWFCTYWCDAPATGVKDRSSRPAQWREMPKSRAKLGRQSGSLLPVLQGSSTEQLLVSHAREQTGLDFVIERSNEDRLEREQRELDLAIERSKEEWPKCYTCGVNFHPDNHEFVQYRKRFPGFGLSSDNPHRVCGVRDCFRKAENDWLDIKDELQKMDEVLQRT